MTKNPFLVKKGKNIRDENHKMRSFLHWR